MTLPCVRLLLSYEAVYQIWTSVTFRFWVTGAHGTDGVHYVTRPSIRRARNKVHMLPPSSDEASVRRSYSFLYISFKLNNGTWACSIRYYCCAEIVQTYSVELQHVCIDVHICSIWLHSLSFRTLNTCDYFFHLPSEIARETQVLRRSVFQWTAAGMLTGW